MPTFIDWKPVDPKNPPKPAAVKAFLFWWNGAVFSGFPLYDPEEFLDKRDDEGYPMWDMAEGPYARFAGVRWYAETYNRPGEGTDKP